VETLAPCGHHVVRALTLRRRSRRRRQHPTRVRARVRASPPRRARRDPAREHESRCWCCVRWLGRLCACDSAAGAEGRRRADDRGRALARASGAGRPGNRPLRVRIPWRMGRRAARRPGPRRRRVAAPAGEVVGS